MGKTCGACQGCCVAPRLDALDKPEFTRCGHLERGCQGCTIYEERPEECRTFECCWLTSPSLPSRFRPDRCGLLLAARPGNKMDVWELDHRKWLGSRLERFLGGLPGWHITVRRQL